MIPFSRHRFIERSLHSALSFMKDALFAEVIAARPGLLQSLDPRVKMVTILLFVLATLFSRHLPVLCALYGVCLGLAWLSNISLVVFLKRTLFFVPVFSMIIVLPSIFSVVTPGSPVCSLGPLVVTKPGLTSAGFVLGRVLTSVSYTILLSLTTRHTALLKALRVLGVPTLFVLVLGMCARYLWLFIGTVESTYRAIQSRVGVVTNPARGQRIVAWKIAHLWIHSAGLSERVYAAMVARGFRGEPIPLNRFQTQTRDWVWSSCVLIIVTVLCLWERNPC